MLPQGDIVDKEPSAELVCDCEGDQRSPGDSEDHIEGDGEGTHPPELIVPAEVVDGRAADGERVEDDAERDVSCVLLFLLREEILVGFVLEFSALSHCLFPNHFFFSTY